MQIFIRLLIIYYNINIILLFPKSNHYLILELFSVNGSPAKTKLYHGAAIASAPEQQHLHQDRIVRYRVNTSFPSFGSARVPSLYNYHAYANISTSSRIYEKTSSKVCLSLTINIFNKNYKKIF